MDQTAERARRLFENWNSRAPYETLSGANAIDRISEAYDVQLALQQLHAENRGTIAGRKIALSSKAMQQMIGIDHPIAGAIFSSEIKSSPATVKATDFVRLGLEFELAIELNSDIAPQSSIHSGETVCEHIAAVRPAFELIEDRNADYAKLDPMTLIADNAWCGGVVLGPALSNWQGLDLADIPSLVHQTGKPIEETNTGAADPLNSLAWVLNHFSGRGIKLFKGEHIITGSAVRTRFPKTGDSLVYEVADASVQISVI
ncbi:MAG: hypothetical protein GKR97_12230 [Rhizobiaceae bacterium]|nr:hypothetical protein [Rhizobiaceae bacterium]